MLPFEDRFTRQRRVKQVGRSGQLRLSRATARLASAGPAVDGIAHEYLSRAGVAAIEITNALPAQPFPHADAFAFSASKAVAHGAWLALSQIRQILVLAKDGG